jgi:DNA repair exonuclease SbcCD nuclease subunit
MNEIKFVHCADLHLDAPFTSLGGEKEKSSERRQDLKDTFQKIINLAASEKSDLLLISGDLYEHSYAGKSLISFLNSCFRSIPHTRVIIIPGNHDPITANSFYRNCEWEKNVHILSEDMPYVCFDEINTCVYGIGFKSFSKESAGEYDFTIAHPEYINIMLAHGTVDMNIGDGIYNPMSSEALAALGMDYVALGHFHNRIDDIGGKKTLYNPGSPDPLGFDETGAHGVYKGSIRKDEGNQAILEINFEQMNKKTYEVRELRVDGCGSNEEVIARISDSLEYRDFGNTLLSLALKGHIENGFRIDTQKIPLSFKDRLYYLKIKDETEMSYNVTEIAREPGLKGLYARKMIARMEKTDDQNQKAIIQKALYYGLEALQNGKLEI